MLVRLGGAATFPSFRHDGGWLAGKWGLQPILRSLISVGGVGGEAHWAIPHHRAHRLTGGP